MGRRTIRAVQTSGLAAQPHLDLVQLAQQHGVEVVDLLVQVRNLEALDGTPIIDVKPILSPDISQR